MSGKLDYQLRKAKVECTLLKSQALIARAEALMTQVENHVSRSHILLWRVQELRQSQAATRQGL
jgi:hypothetical protein